MLQRLCTASHPLNIQQRELHLQLKPTTYGTIYLQVCNHRFHNECLQRWGDTKCPVCRYCAQSSNDQSKCNSCSSTQASCSVPVVRAEFPHIANQSKNMLLRLLTGVYIAAGGLMRGILVLLSRASAHRQVFGAPSWCTIGSLGELPLVVSCFTWHWVLQEQLRHQKTSWTVFMAICEWPGLLQDLWICLICGHIGCGRYHSKHAVAHWRETQHCYALDLETQRARQLHAARLRDCCPGGTLTAACHFSGMLSWQSAAFSLCKCLHAASLQDGCECTTDCTL